MGKGSLTPGYPANCPTTAATSEVWPWAPPRWRAGAAADTCRLSPPLRLVRAGASRGHLEVRRPTTALASADQRHPGRPKTRWPPPPPRPGVRTMTTAGACSLLGVPPLPPQGCTILTPPADLRRGERFLGGVRVHDVAPSTGLCVTGTMAEFRALSLAEERFHLEAQPPQARRVDRVALVPGVFLATVQHGPTATKVVGVPLTDALARTLGIQLSILTGKVNTAERAVLGTRWPKVLWMFVPDMAD